MTTGKATGTEQSSNVGSVVIRKALGRQLKALRLAAGKTPADIELSGIAGPSKLRRLEAGTVPVKIADVWALCRLYNADSVTTDKLADMAKNTNQQGWWEDYGDVMPSWFSSFVELEAVASQVWNYDGELIHGLLQTPAYHRAVVEEMGRLTSEAAERHIQLRLDRQRAAFERTPPLEVNAIIGEGALKRLVGGRDVMDEQMAHLRAMARRPDVEVLVLPWEAGAHPGMRGAFTIVQVDDPEHPDVVYLETHAGARYMVQAATTAEYHRMYEILRSKPAIRMEEYLR